MVGIYISFFGFATTLVGDTLMQVTSFFFCLRYTKYN